jgi:hypothetical protein
VQAREQLRENTEVHRKPIGGRLGLATRMGGQEREVPRAFRGSWSFFDVMSRHTHLNAGPRAPLRVITSNCEWPDILARNTEAPIDAHGSSGCSGFVRSSMHWERELSRR